MKKVLSKKGFTLVELVVVIAIIAVLAVLIVAAIQAARRQAINTQRSGNVRTLETALEAFANANGGKYPGDAAPMALQGTLQTGSFLTQAINGLNDNDYGYGATGCSGNPSRCSYYELVACNIGNTNTGANEPDPTAAIGAVGGCTGSTIGVKASR